MLLLFLRHIHVETYLEPVNNAREGWWVFDPDVPLMISILLYLVGPSHTSLYFSLLELESDWWRSCKDPGELSFIKYARLSTFEYFSNIQKFRIRIMTP